MWLIKVIVPIIFFCFIFMLPYTNALIIENGTIQTQTKVTNDDKLFLDIDLIQHIGNKWILQVITDTKLNNLSQKYSISNVPISICATKSIFDNISFFAGSVKNQRCFNYSIPLINSKTLFNISILSNEQFLNLNVKLGDNSELIVFGDTSGYWVNNSYYRWFIEKDHGTPMRIYPSNSTNQMSDPTYGLIRFDVPLVFGGDVSGNDCNIFENNTIYAIINCSHGAWKINYTFYDNETGVKITALNDSMGRSYGFLTASTADRLSWNASNASTNYTYSTLPTSETNINAWGFFTWYLSTERWTFGYSWTQNNTLQDIQGSGGSWYSVLGSFGAGNYERALNFFLLHVNESAVNKFDNFYRESMKANDKFNIQSDIGTFTQKGDGTKSNTTARLGVNGYEINATMDGNTVAGWVNRSETNGDVFIHVLNDTVPTDGIWYFFRDSNLMGWINATGGDVSDSSILARSSVGFYIKSKAQKESYINISDRYNLIPTNINLTWVNPTLSSDTVSYYRYLYANITSSLILDNCTLSYWDEIEWHNITQSPTTDYSCYFKTSELGYGYYEYRIYATGQTLSNSTSTRTINKANSLNFFMDIAKAVFKFFWTMGAVEI